MKIAIDGTAASGKGTLARGLAKKLGFDYLDTGLLYRSIALNARKQGITNCDFAVETGIISTRKMKKLTDTALLLKLPLPDQPDFRSQEISLLASKIANLSELRDILLKKQRTFANKPPSGKGVILDGRDIGSIILPDAKFKFFIDAKPEIRAKRRYAELKKLKLSVSEQSILDDINKRDVADRTRQIAPLTCLPNALFIDSSLLNSDEVLQIALNYING